MARAFAHASAAPFARALVVSTHQTASLPPSFAFIKGSHPVPDGASEQAGRAALDLVSSAAGARVVVLLSGGASALLAVPADGISLDDKRGVTRRLLASGADIHALNTVRKHLSAIKGGRLAAAATGPVLAFAVSDVVGDDLSVIASGPTVPDPTTFHDALAVLDRFGGRSSYPAAAVRLLEDGAAGLRPETPKPGDASFSTVETRVIGSRVDCMRAAAGAAAHAGYEPVIIEQPVVGESREVARVHVVRMLRMAEEKDAPAAVVSTGETTVRVVGTGRGGRNQEFALAAAATLARASRPAVLARVGTDGIDGPTDAAGAVADNETIERLGRAGVSVTAALDNNDSYRAFDALGDLLITGPTNTNVGDLQVLLVARGARS